MMKDELETDANTIKSLEGLSNFYAIFVALLTPVCLWLAMEDHNEIYIAMGLIIVASVLLFWQISKVLVMLDRKLDRNYRQLVRVTELVIDGDRGEEK